MSIIPNLKYLSMNRLSHYMLFLFSLVLFQACENAPSEERPDNLLRVNGNTMGTTYSIMYLDAEQRELKGGIDSVLKELNQEVSTYIKSSRISRFNDDTIKKELHILPEEPQHFIRNLEIAKRVAASTDHWFEPTVKPLVDYWGFGKEKRAVEKVDSNQVDALQRLVGFTKISWGPDSSGTIIVKKAEPALQLDLSAIAKGYGVDIVGEFLESKGVENYMVEIGREVRTRGSKEGEPWRIGISTPEEGSKEVQVILELKNHAVATSGNYQNFYEVNGQKYAHTINPKTGYPQKNRLLSVSIIAPDCATADAFATACLSMGKSGTEKVIANQKGVYAYLIYSDENGEMQTSYTEGLEKLIVE